MADNQKKPGPEPELFKVPLPFKDAVKAALETKPPPPKRRKKKKSGPRKSRS
jgi:hypothetical protein